MADCIQIPEVSEDSRFWMLRTKDGVFFEEFLQKQYIALGWNQVTKMDLHTKLDGEIRDILGQKYREKKPGQALNKCRRFVEEMREGDYLLLVGKEKVALTIVGEYYELETKDPVAWELNFWKTEAGKDGNRVCPYIKRRKIKALRRLPTKNVTPILAKMLTGNMHSLSNIDSYADYVLPMCYDAYFYQGKFSMVFHVEKDSGINTLSLCGFLQGSSLLLGEAQHGDLTTRMNLNSPGDIILELVSAGLEGLRNSSVLLILYLAILGGKCGSVEFQSLLGVIEKIARRKEAWEERELERQRKREEIEGLRLDNEQKRLNNRAKEKELREAEKKKAAETAKVEQLKFYNMPEEFHEHEKAEGSVCPDQENVDKIIDLARRVRESAGELEIRAVDSNVIDLKAYLEQEIGQ